MSEVYPWVLLADQPIPALVALVKSSDDEQQARGAMRELNRRGVSIVGIIPTGARPKQPHARVDGIPLV